MSNVINYKDIRRYDDLDTRILDLIYNRDITVMAFIIKKLMFMAHRVTISKRIKTLHKEGFIYIVENCNPVCIKPIEQKREIILKMINTLKIKWRLVQ